MTGSGRYTGLVPDSIPDQPSKSAGFFMPPDTRAKILKTLIANGGDGAGPFTKEFVENDPNFESNAEKFVKGVVSEDIGGTQVGGLDDWFIKDRRLAQHDSLNIVANAKNCPRNVRELILCEQASSLGMLLEDLKQCSDPKSEVFLCSTARTMIASSPRSLNDRHVANFNEIVSSKEPNYDMRNLRTIAHSICGNRPDLADTGIKKLADPAIVSHMEFEQRSQNSANTGSKEQAKSGIASDSESNRRRLIIPKI